MRVIVAAAGTGGHINPGIAIANKIKQENPESKIIFIGTQRGLENDLVPRAGYELKTIEAYGLVKKISIDNFRKIIKTMHSYKDAEKIVKEFKPDLVVGTGGYICGPVVSAACKLGIPTILHESNAYPGLAVKNLSKKVDTIMVGFKEAKERLTKAKNVVVTGTPTKIKDLNIGSFRRLEIFSQLGLKDNKPIVLVFGGSQGAKKINEAMMPLLKEKRDYQIVWAPGPAQYEIIKSELDKQNINIKNVTDAKIVPYIYNMEEMLNICNLVVARSGAMTITELALVGKPAIFIPLPSRSANRQEDNARVMEKLGAAKVILNEDLTPEVLSKDINEMVKDKEKLTKMGENARKIAIYDVEDKIYSEIKKIVKIAK